MGREIKRVPLDFDYPINKMIWKGYHNPYRGLECSVCGGNGQSEAYNKLYAEWYGLPSYADGWNRWLTQEDVDALVEADRLWDFTRVPINEEQSEIVKKRLADGHNSWLPFNNGRKPTAEEVNEWSKKGLGHDAINAWVCISARLKRMGLDCDCLACGGNGSLWPDEKYQKLAEEFEPIDPPKGDGYQLWSTTTEGTPMSPVFSTPEELARYLSDKKVSSFGSNSLNYEQWLRFIKGPGWAPSAVLDSSGLQSGVEAVK